MRWLPLKNGSTASKSENRHQPTGPVKANIGDQLLLAMEVRQLGCMQNKRPSQRSRALTNNQITTPKKPGGRHDFPAGLEEEITVIDAVDKPVNAKCVGHVDQRQLACDPMRWYIKITRRLIYLAPVDDDLLNYKQLIIAPLEKYVA